MKKKLRTVFNILEISGGHVLLSLCAKVLACVQCKTIVVWTFRELRDKYKDQQLNGHGSMRNIIPVKTVS